ncbi:DUF4347 domain-containing protein [Salinimonas marina]|uniref:DUF4347 domain-containing protein n=1 Tax=Salinimonas marina TaxID=2785918 RepID=A0A7S9DXS0_9ALTE|nr:putative Ig domain-containing protein [Salinimonas marina]QPG05858.1 DUF4347 domain-containing protein [Salinimonas marina]
MTSQCIRSAPFVALALAGFSLNAHASQSAQQASHSLVVIDSTAPDAAWLYATAVKNGHQAVILNSETSGIEQLQSALASNGGQIRDLHLISHGADGQVFLGSDILEANSASMAKMSALQQFFAPGADVKLYGCDIARTDSGEYFVKQLADAMQVDVAASSDTTGGDKYAANWTLEYTVGDIDEGLFAQQSLLSQYNGYLSHFRGGGIKWIPVDADGDGQVDDVRLYMTTAWAVGKSELSGRAELTNATITPVEITSQAVLKTINDPDADGEYDLLTQVFEMYDVDPAVSYQVQYDGGNRIGGLNNNANGRWDIQTLVYTGEGNKQAGLDLPIVFEVPKQNGDGSVLTNWTYQTNVVDPNGDEIKYRLASLEELGGGSSANPPGIDIDQTTGLITWTGSGTRTAGLYSAGFVAEDVDASGSVKSKAHFDIILYLINGPATEKFEFSEDIPQETKTAIVSPDTPLLFSIDEVSGSTVTSTNLGNVRNENGDLALSTLDSGQYQFDANGLTSGTYPITFQIEENGKVKAYQTINFVVPDPLGPQLTYYPGDGAYSLDGARTFVDVGRDGFLTDADSADLQGGKLRIDTTRIDGANEILSVDSAGTGPGEILVNDPAGTIAYQGVDFATISSSQNGAGGPLVIDFTGSTSLDAAEALVRALTYENTAATPTDGLRTLSLVLSDEAQKSNLFNTSVTLGSLANDAPQANGTLSNQTFLEKEPFSFAIPTNFFTDSDGDTISYSVSGLPAGVTFDGASQSFTGPTSVIGQHTVLVSAQDGKGGTATAQFTLYINANTAPTVNNTIPNTHIAEDQLMTTINVGSVFNDPEGKALDIVVTDLPDGVSFDSHTLEISGTPTTPGDNEVTITATDTSGESASTGFRLSVTNTNDAPTAGAALVNQTTDITTSPATYQFAANSFSDEDMNQGQADSLTFTAELTDGAPLPDFISLNSADRTFTYVHDWYDRGTFDIRVIAKDDAGESVFQDYTLTITGTNTNPMRHHFEGLDVNENSNAFFMHNSLHYMDHEQLPVDLVYTITQLPAAGALYKNDALLNVGDSFTQLDIDEMNVVEYRHDGSEDPTDTFFFTLSDGFGGFVAEVTDFAIRVAPVNDTPEINQGLEDQNAIEGVAFSYTVPDTAFSDIEEDVLTLQVTSALPAWISFDGATLTGTPGPGDVGGFNVTIAASDPDGSAVDATFALFVLKDSDGDGEPDNTDPDTDGDGFLNSEDAFPLDAAEWVDTDLDGIGNNADTNDDNDAVEDSRDAFPLDPTETLDTDNDGIGNNADTDDDGDKVADRVDVFPLDPTESLDTDADGIGNNADTDDDNDNVEDRRDAFPLDPKETLDTDNDGIGNNADTDDDGDGMPDSYEAEQGFDSLDASDGRQDLDGDGTINSEEFLQNSDPFTDERGPVFAPVAPFIIDATGTFTRITAQMIEEAIEVSVTSALDADCCKPELVGLEAEGTQFRPGRHILTWKAVDAEGNVGEIEQIVDIYPQASLSRDVQVKEGAVATVTLILNGELPEYPATYNFTVSGTAEGEDYELSAQSFTITSGATATIDIDLTDDGLGENVDTLTLALDNRHNVGVKPDITLDIVETNAAPQLRLSTFVDGSPAAVVTPEDGILVVNLDITDPGDIHTIQWEVPEGITIVEDENGKAIGISAIGLPLGPIDLTVTVTDNGSPALSSIANIIIPVISERVALNGSTDSDGDGINDADEGWTDADRDGIPDYLDNNDVPYLLPERGIVKDAYIVEGDVGLKLKLGRLSSFSTYTGAQVTEADFAKLNIEPDTIENVGGYFDFIAERLPEGTVSINVVLPQRAAIPEAAVYRKYMPASGWQTYVEDGNNMVKSALGEPGYCPEPGSSEYKPGLTEGDWCVQLTIEDGGPNDADGEVNGIVRDPSGVGKPEIFNSKVVVTSKSGGSFGMLSYLALGLAVIWRQKRLLLALSLMITATASQASDKHRLYLKGGLGNAKYNLDENNIRQKVMNVSDTAVFESISEDSKSYWLDFGYRITPRWALEIGTVDLGENQVSFTDQITEFEIDTYLGELDFDHPSSASGESIAISYGQQINEDLSWRIRVGKFWYDADYNLQLDVEGTQIDTGRETVSDSELFFGGNLQWHIAKQFSVGLTARRYEVAGNYVRLVGVNIQYQFYQR